MVNDLYPEYLSSLVPPTVGSLMPHATNIKTIPFAFQLYYNPFLPSRLRIYTTQLLVTLISKNIVNSPFHVVHLKAYNNYYTFNKNACLFFRIRVSTLNVFKYML